MASLLKRWLLGTRQGSVRPEHLDAYLSEFIFRFNRGTSRRRGMLFYRLLEQAVANRPRDLPAALSSTRSPSAADQCPGGRRANPSSRAWLYPARHALARIRRPNLSQMDPLTGETADEAATGPLSP